MRPTVLTVHAHHVFLKSTTETKNEKTNGVGAPQVDDSGVIDHGMDDGAHYDEPDHDEHVGF